MIIFFVFYRCKFYSYFLFFLFLNEPKRIFSFKSDKENNIGTVGETVKIICKAEGQFPASNYTIFHNGVKLTDNRVKTIEEVNTDDGGRYECVAKNDLGEFSASFNLTVKGKICLETCLSEMVSARHEKDSLHAGTKATSFWLVQPSFGQAASD